MRHLSKRTLAVHKRASEDNLPDYADIFSTEKSKGRGGVVVKAAPQKVGSCRCRMVPVTDVEESVKGDALALEARWVITVPITTDVRIGHRAEITGHGYKRTVDVVGAANPRSFATLRRVFARDVLE